MCWLSVAVSGCGKWNVHSFINNRNELKDPLPSTFEKKIVCTLFEKVLKVTCKHMYKRVIKYVKYLNGSDIIKFQMCLLLLVQIAQRLKQNGILNLVIIKKIRQVLVLRKMVLFLHHRSSDLNKLVSRVL